MLCGRWYITATADHNSLRQPAVAVLCWLMVMISHQTKAPGVPLIASIPSIASISPANAHSHACDTKCVAVPGEGER